MTALRFNLLAAKAAIAEAAVEQFSAPAPAAPAKPEGESVLLFAPDAPASAPSVAEVPTEYPDDPAPAPWYRKVLDVVKGAVIFVASEGKVLASLAAVGIGGLSGPIQRD
jgi:hypothetical protein